MAPQDLTNPVLSISRLRVAFRVGGQMVQAVSDASLEIQLGEAVGLVGESGSGKSTVARSVLGLHPVAPCLLEAERFRIAGTDLDPADRLRIAQLRGKVVAMVFQDPLTYLNPLQRIETQIQEALALHDPASDFQARVRELLELVRLPQRTARAYPHEISGGMRQRALLSMALACKPQLLLADEPTTALDVTTQAEILELIKDIQRELRMSLLLISHDLGAIAEVCDRVVVMYSGRTIEQAGKRKLFLEPAHPYTQSLLRAAQAERDEQGRFITLAGEMKSGQAPRGGCVFFSRCSERLASCETLSPPRSLVNEDPTHWVHCWKREGANAHA